MGPIRVLAQIYTLDIQAYACGLKLDAACILDQNPLFEMASINTAIYLNAAPGLTPTFFKMIARGQKPVKAA